MTNDSPHLRAMAETLPEGDGDVLADAAYGGVQNCNAIRDGGRIIDTKSNDTIKVFNARVEVLRFRKEHPRTFHQILSLWNNVETSMKARFGGVVRALKDIIGGVAVNDYNMVFV